MNEFETRYYVSVIYSLKSPVNPQIYPMYSTLEGCVNDFLKDLSNRSIIKYATVVKMSIDETTFTPLKEAIRKVKLEKL